MSLTDELDEALADLLGQPGLPLARKILLLLGLGRFSEAVLRQSLSRPVPKKAKAVELKLRKHLASIHGTPGVIEGYFQHVDSSFPREALAKAPFLREAVRLQHTVMEYHRGPVLKEAFDWASSALEANPELALRLCASSQGARFLSLGCGVLLRPGGGPTGGTKRMERGIEQLLSRFSYMSSHVEKLVASHPDLDEDELLALAADEQVGGLKTVMWYALVWQFIAVARLLSAVFLGGSDSIQDDLEEVDVDDMELTESVLEVCSLRTALGLDGDLISFLLEYAPALADKYRYQWVAYSDTAHHIQDLLDESNATEKAYKKEVHALRKQLKEQEQVVHRVSTAAAQKTVGSGAAEVLALQQQLARAREESAKKDAHIAQLQRKLSLPAEPELTAVAPRVPEPAPVPTSVVSAASMPHVSYEEALVKLQSLRGVLVGGHSNFHRKVRDLLPGWTFYSADDKTVDEGLVRGAELLVLFTSHCNHPLTTSVLRLARTHDLALVYAYKVNPSAFVCEVVSKLEDQASLA